MLILFLIVVGHLGGNLTHSVLFEYALNQLKQFDFKQNKKFEEVPLDSIGVYKDLIHPIF